MKTCWLILLLLTLGSACRADRDIVYAARYYAPSGSGKTSHFHLYRINPDGTGRTQLTFGAADDAEPQWSPDGKWIVFLRVTAGGLNRYCLVRSDGGPIRSLKIPGLAVRVVSDFTSVCWAPTGNRIAIVYQNPKDEFAAYSSVYLVNEPARTIWRRFGGVGNFQWSPDGRHAYVRISNVGQFIDLNTGRKFAAQTTRPLGLNIDNSVMDNSVAWADSKTLVELVGTPEKAQVTLLSFDVYGKEKRRILCCWGKSPQDPYIDSIDFGGRSLLPLPYPDQRSVYVQDVGNSGTRPDSDYYLADTATGQMTELTSGQFLTWSCDGSQFCTAEARYLADYGKPENGYQRSLYVASLQVGQKKNSRVKNITPGLVWVTAADWRKS